MKKLLIQIILIFIFLAYIDFSLAQEAKDQTGKKPIQGEIAADSNQYSAAAVSHQDGNARSAHTNRRHHHRHTTHKGAAGAIQRRHREGHSRCMGG